MTQVQPPQWSGLTIVIGDHTHILPEGEDDRTHDVLTGPDCACGPEVVGQTHPGVVGSKHEPPRTILQHKPLPVRR